MENNESNKISPPYISWDTLKNFLRTLKDSAVPSRIDSSMMPSTMSGFNKAGVTSALRFFSLIDSNGEAADYLKEIVEACDTKDWSDAAKKILVPAYRNIIGDLKLNTATRKQLEEKFGEASSTMKDRFIRFYIPMLQDVDIEVSPYLTARQNKPRKSGLKKTVKKKKYRTAQGERSFVEPDQPTLNVAPEGMFDQPIPIVSDNSCYIRIPRNITVSQVALVKAAVAFIEAMAQQNKESKK